MKHFILSNSETQFGIGMLHRFRQDSVKSIDYDKDRERGAFRIVSNSGTEWFGHDLLVLEPSIDDIESMDVDEFIDSDKMDLSFLLS